MWQLSNVALAARDGGVATGDGESVVVATANERFVVVATNVGSVSTGDGGFVVVATANKRFVVVLVTNVGSGD